MGAPRASRGALRIARACCIVLAVIAVACGAGGARPAPPIAATPVIADASVESGGDAADAAPALPSLDEMAARAPSLAAGMREVNRQEVDGVTSLEIARASSNDVCARVSLAATRAVHAWLEDAHGGMLADASPAGHIALAARGPVCVRRGDAIVLRIEAGEAFHARIVAWASP